MSAGPPSLTPGPIKACKRSSDRSMETDSVEIGWRDLWWRHRD